MVDLLKWIIEIPRKIGEIRRIGESLLYFIVSNCHCSNFCYCCLFHLHIYHSIVFIIY